MWRVRRRDHVFGQGDAEGQAQDVAAAAAAAAAAAFGAVSEREPAVARGFFIFRGGGRVAAASVAACTVFFWRF